MPLREVQLDDKYILPGGRLLLSGTQALVRIPLMQRAIDRAAGLNTATFISGYRGSPLGTYDMELGRTRRLLTEHEITFHPAVNEEVAATAVWGSQQVTLLPEPRCDGITGIWYGKGPGVDRAGDAIRHGNLAGASQYGGVLLVFGDDHPGKSSTTAHQSDQAVAAHSIPILYPATISDYLEFGLQGIAMSRYSGLWVGIKCVNETVENTATVDVAETIRIETPENISLPPGGLNTRLAFDPSGWDKLVQRFRLPAAQAFARANGIDRIVVHGSPRRLGIISAGKAYLDLMQALSFLGLDVQAASACGIGVYKIGMIWPVEQAGLTDFGADYDELLVVEEKRAFIEPQLKDALYKLVKRPRITGKTDVDGTILQPSDVQIDPLALARLIADRLEALGAMDHRMAARQETIQARLRRENANPPEGIARTPYFCSGCPHNTSTKVPDGSLALCGIGCNTMAIWMDRHNLPPTQMGGEGGNWIGIAPFTDVAHIFQNIGDGTYFHSGYMSIRAAIDAGVNITYKILYNDATAMTGGQPTKATANIGVDEIVRQIIAEGARKVVLVSDDIDKYKKGYSLPGGISIRHRDELDAVQRELREISGTTVIVYDQVCAAEKRRRRKRGQLEDPERRIFINSAVCEGCGDCSRQSNCVSIQPVETEHGRKRRIDQSNCNKDYSCVNGFCPSFVSIIGGALRKPASPSLDDDLFSQLAMPDLPGLETPYSILLTGIGGTGVTTVSAILGMAAHMDHKASSAYNMTGLAQKGGAVTSHLRLANNPEAIGATRIGTAEANLLLGCDLIVSGATDTLDTMESGSTHVVVNTTVVPTGAFQLNPDMDFREVEFLEAIRAQAGTDRVHSHDFSAWALSLMGDTIASNLMLVGYAFQTGLLPISAEALESAIRLNGVKVDFNLSAFRLGRLAAQDLVAFSNLLPGRRSKVVTLEPPQSLRELIERQRAWLCDYQNAVYADRYSRLVDDVRRRDTGPDQRLTRAVARYYAKLMAYKDEYEVARLYTNGEFLNAVRREFEGDIRFHFHMAPPMLPGRKGADARPHKRTFGPWMMGILRILAKLKPLRGTPLDIFSWSAERRGERALIKDYENDMYRLLEGLNEENYDIAVQIASLPDAIRGFGCVKEQSVAESGQNADMLWKAFREDKASAVDSRERTSCST